MKKNWSDDLTLVKELMNHESPGGKPVLKPYRCTEGYLTIGHGRNLEGKGISELEAHLMLLNDIKDICRELDDLLPWWRSIDPIAQRVLINMSMMGTRKLLKFEKMLAHLRAGHYDQAASELINSKYAKQTKTRATYLFNVMRTIPRRK